MRDRIDLLARLRTLPPDAAAALVTVVRVEGSSYRREGTRLLIEGDGRLTGLVSGGCLERELASRAPELTAAGPPRLLVYDLTGEQEAIWGFGTGCAGRLSLWIEPLTAGRRAAAIALLADLVERRVERRVATRFVAAGALPAEGVGEGEQIAARLAALAPGEVRTARLPAAGGPLGLLLESLLPAIHLLIVGSGRDVEPLAGFGRHLGWATTVVEPGSPPLARLAAEFEISPRTAVVVATHRYLDDLAAVESLAGGPAGYFALLGPAARRERLLDDLARRAPALAEQAGARLRGPAGLDLGGRAPEEVALAIVAEIQAVFSGRDARPLTGKPPA